MTGYSEEPYLEEWEYPEEEMYEPEYAGWGPAYEVGYAEHGYEGYGYPGSYLPARGLPVTAVLVISVVLVLALGSLTGGGAPLFNFTGMGARDASSGEASSEEVSAEQAASQISGTSPGGELAPLFTPQVQAWSGDIAGWAEAWQMDPNLIATVMQIESCGDPQAVSSAGAMGLFQVMPFHFAAGEDGHDPQTNARRGLAYLQNALNARDGEVRLAFAGYNAGINGAKRPENLWPSETLRYVQWAMGIYSDAIEGKAESSTLQEWLARGGAGLCDQAGRRLGLAP